jgi:hypothetical protein
MESLNTNDRIPGKMPSLFNDRFNQKFRDKVSDKFDLSVIGRIDLTEAEKIAQEEIIFLNEIDLIEGLEEFELVPLKDLNNKKIVNEIFIQEKPQETTDKVIYSEEKSAIESIIKSESDVSEQTFPEDITDLKVEAVEPEVIQELPDDSLYFFKEENEKIKIEEQHITDDKSLIIDNKLSSILDKEVAEQEVLSDSYIIIEETTAESELKEYEKEEELVETDDFSIRNQFHIHEILDLREKTFNELLKINLFNKNLLYSDLFTFPDFECNSIFDVIISNEYYKYLNYIDEYQWNESNKKSPDINHWLNFSCEEIKFIEQKLFYENELISEKENDLIFNVSDELLIEENVSDLNEYLNNYDNKENIKRDIPVETDEIAEKYQDITDKIIILEDKEMVEVFANRFPGKHQNLIKLLSYLDGLFEKLPEEVIHKFVESEYFGLYSTLLQEIGD